MSLIVTEPDGSKRDLIKQPRGYGYCFTCKDFRNYGCSKGENVLLCTAKEYVVREQNETCLTFTKQKPSIKETTIPAKRPEQPFINLVNMLEDLAQADPAEYCKVVRSGIFNELLRNSELQLKELNLLKSDKQ
jgi:hypothetical protein